MARRDDGPCSKPAGLLGTHGSSVWDYQSCLLGFVGLVRWTWYLLGSRCARFSYSLPSIYLTRSPIHHHHHHHHHHHQ